MGDAGSEYASETPGFGVLAELGEAEHEALSNDAALRELVRLWSTLESSVQLAILTIAQSRASQG